VKVKRSEVVYIQGRGSSDYVATSYRLDGPGFFFRALYSYFLCFSCIFCFLCFVVLMNLHCTYVCVLYFTVDVHVLVLYFAMCCAVFVRYAVSFLNVWSL
jgi:hypothetical protein